MNETEIMLNQNPLRIISVTGPDINNGTGMRITIWVAGCNHHCPGCQNEHTWVWEQGHLIDDVREKIFELCENSNIDGITISGGDPLAQSERALTELTCFLEVFNKKFPKKNVWLYTGYEYEQLDKLQLKVLEHCNVLVDGPYMYKNRDVTLPFRGSSNQRIIDLCSSTQNHIVIIDDEEFKK